MLKQIIAISILALPLCAFAADAAKAPAAASAAAPAASAAEKKKVCVKQKDAKTGQEKEQCKMVKKHEKLEGKKVPEAKK